VQTESQIRRNRRVVYRDLAPGQGGVLLHLGTGQYHGVNVLGARIWQLIDGDAAPARIAAKLRSQSEESSPDLQGDIERFLASLHRRGLIVG
jgi:coenzyme PQQ synthesis protein D (PqqD)